LFAWLLRWQTVFTRDVERQRSPGNFAAVQLANVDVQANRRQADRACVMNATIAAF